LDLEGSGMKGASGIGKKAKRHDHSPAVDLVALAECVEQFASKTIVVLGDFVADEYQFGDISRVSREAPVLILRHRETQLFPGGGANAANNFATLGARVLPVTAVGDDDTGAMLTQYFRERGVGTQGVLRLRHHATPTKTRFLAGWAHTVAQQVLRVDREPKFEMPDNARKELLVKLKSNLKSADALAISDYGFGVATAELVRQARTGAKNAVPITLDARHQLNVYTKAGITSATPNEAELEALHHVSIGQNVEQLKRCGFATLAQMKLQALLVTRGRHGMALFEPGSRFTQIPVHGSDQAVDVTGAGDTVLATYTLALASGASALEAAHVANIAGGLVVMKRGTATVSREELLGAIRAQASGAAG
jgi:D-glycero-beta-D-manno-heptose-7-phosphate kinase